MNTLDFGKWRITSLFRTDGLLTAECGNECLLWHSALGLGVRTDFHLSQTQALNFQNGSFFVATGSALYIVPLLTEEGEASAAFATPLPTRVPAELPFVRPRLLSAQPDCMAPQKRPDASLLPPLFLSTKADRLICI